MEEPAEDVLRFIADRIDTVPELEALLLFWEQRPTTSDGEANCEQAFCSARRWRGGDQIASATEIRHGDSGRFRICL